MDNITKIILVSVIILLIGSLTWLLVDLSSKKNTKSKPKKRSKNSKSQLLDLSESSVEHIFNEEFRQELRNRGRLHFEKIIAENAMFLQQDLRLTTSAVNDYMKQEIQKVLREEFAKYEQSIAGAKEVAIESLKKTQEAIESQRKILETQLGQLVSSEKARIIQKFEQNMAEIFNHYIIEAVGNQIDLSVQLDYIMSQLNENKKAIIEDIKNGA